MKTLVIQIKNAATAEGLASIESLALQADTGAVVRLGESGQGYCNALVSGYADLRAFWGQFYPLLLADPLLADNTIVVCGSNPDTSSFDDGYFLLHSMNASGEELHRFDAEPVGYFQFDEEEFAIALVTKAYWDEHGHMDGNGLDDRLLPPGFYELSESVYETDLDTEDAKAALRAAGWEEKMMFEV